MRGNPTLPREIVAVWLDETANYEIDPADAPLIERIIGVYVFDRSEYTYCCEATPSHFLHHVYDAVWTTPECPDEDRERLHDRYILPCSDVSDHYRHVRAVAALPPERFHAYRNDDPEDDDYRNDDPEDDDEAAIEAAIEHFSGNCPF